ncbi:hypothetical protein VNO80_35204 [Phaseolus coccineus]|uniref:Uncharacterized protein n=1 Tax=Phaseolus coccineus TaxID=3886 RepID=A0AAN9KQH7_PHACN
MCSNFWPCTDHLMDHGLNGHCLKGLCPVDRRPPTRYISRLWAAITIQEDTRNWKDKQTHPVDCRATSPTTQERDSLKSQGRGWPRGPTWRLGISAGNAKIIIGNTLTLGTGAWPKSRVAQSSIKEIPVLCPIH